MSAFLKFKEDFLDKGLEYFGLYYGTYEGIVVNNNDKDNGGKLLVKCPAVWGEDDNVKIWALPRGVYAGKKTGFHAMPEKDDVVWITFRGGKPEYPLWEYGWWLQGNSIEVAKKGVYVLATPKGHTFVIDENNNNIYLSFKDGKNIEIKGNKISLGKLGGSDEKAALGDTLKSKLEEILDNQKDICDAIVALTVTCSAPGSPSTIPVNSSLFTTLGIQATTIKNSLNAILSQVVTLD